MDREIMTIKQTAAYLQMSPLSIYKLIRKGDIPATKVLNKWRFRKADIDMFFKKNA